MSDLLLCLDHEGHKKEKHETNLDKRKKLKGNISAMIVWESPRFGWLFCKIDYSVNT